MTTSRLNTAGRVQQSSVVLQLSSGVTGMLMVPKTWRAQKLPLPLPPPLRGAWRSASDSPRPHWQVESTEERHQRRARSNLAREERAFGPQAHVFEPSAAVSRGRSAWRSCCFPSFCSPPPAPEEAEEAAPLVRMQRHPVFFSEYHRGPPVLPFSAPPTPGLNPAYHED
jgi:hypothetical protein